MHASVHTHVRDVRTMVCMLAVSPERSRELGVLESRESRESGVLRVAFVAALCSAVPDGNREFCRCSWFFVYFFFEVLDG